MLKKQKEKLHIYKKKLQKSQSLYRAAEKTVKSLNVEDVGSEIYSFVLAPLILVFIKWIIDNAKRSGTKRLYFLARDGYQMYLVAKYICKEEKTDIDCRYLNCSRYSLRIPQFHIEGEACVEKICLGGIEVTFEKLMERGGLNREEGLEIAKELGYYDRYFDILPYPEVLKLKKPLKNNNKFISYVMKNSQKAYPNTIGYLYQEGLFDEVKYAIVDSGWTGSMQETLQKLLWNEGSQKKLEGYYFGLYEIPQKMHSSKYNHFFFGPKSGLKQKAYFSNCLFETIFSSPESMTIAYSRFENIFVPEKASDENPNYIQIEKNVEILKVFLEKLYEDNFKISNLEEKNNKKTVTSLLTKFMSNPTVEEVEIYGNNLFSDDVTENKLKKVALEISEKDLINNLFWNRVLIMMGLKKSFVVESAWIEGSIVRSGKKIRKNLRHVVLYKYLLYLRKHIKGRLRK